MTDELAGNCHFVSKSLTRPWEFGEHRLHYYDFTTKQLADESADGLFAKVGLHTKSEERWLSDNIESPLGRLRKTFRKIPESLAKSVDDVAALRALFLLIPLQITRAARATNGQNELDDVFTWSNEKIDKLAAAWRSTHRVGLVRANPTFPLFYPEHGFFPVSFPRASAERPAAMAIPLLPEAALVSVPRSMDQVMVRNTLTLGEAAYLNNCSMGVAANRIVVHPEIVEAMDRTAVIQEIKSVRARNRVLFDAANSFTLGGSPNQALNPPGLWPAG